VKAGGPRNFRPQKGTGSRQLHMRLVLISDEFDMAFFQGKPLDHRLLLLSPPCPMLLSHQPAWPMPLIHLRDGCVFSARVRPRRHDCYKLGFSLRAGAAI